MAVGIGRQLRKAFRGFTAAASLKPARGRGARRVDVIFPRFHRRGLIEAFEVRYPDLKADKAFRGFTAAASLKPLKNTPVIN